MGKVIEIKNYRQNVQNNELKEAQKLVEISNSIDNIILSALSDESVLARDLAGVLAHRLGSLIRHVDGKENLWRIYERVLKRQALLGNES